MNRKDLAGHAHGWFRTWFAKIWKVRGGGLYACGYAVTFAYLEVRTIVGEISESDSIGEFFQEQLVEFIFRFASDSIVNLIQALMWPVHIVQYRQPFGAIALGIAFVVFPMTLKKPIEKWLLPETEPYNGKE
jgi:hypothetical protein